MSFTIDFILFFLLIIIPGLIFKLFYFWGEFSKQFKSKGSVYKSVLYSLLPGVVAQTLGLWLFIVSHEDDRFVADVITINASNIIDVIYDLLNEKTSDYNRVTLLFLDKKIISFLIHELYVYLLASGLGFISYLIVRNFRLDCRIKFLRFNNIWYYIFSGEIQRFKKFQKARMRIPIIGDIKGKSSSYYPPYVDILLDTNSGKKLLYTGFVIDYDLNHENTNELDKIYLSNVSRYRDIKEEEVVNDENKFGSKVKVPIEGDYMIIKANQIINMNIQYEIYESRFAKWNKKEKWLQRIYNLGGFLYILVFVYFLGMNSLFKDIFPIVEKHMIDYNIFSKFYSAFIVSIALSILFPSRVKENKNELPDKREEQKEDSDAEDDNENYPEYKFKYDGWMAFAKFINLLTLAFFYYLIYY